MIYRKQEEDVSYPCKYKYGFNKNPYYLNFDSQ